MAVCSVHPQDPRLRDCVRWFLRRFVFRRLLESPVWIAKVRESSGQLTLTLSLLTVRKDRSGDLRPCGSAWRAVFRHQPRASEASGQQLLRTPTLSTVHEELRNRPLPVNHLTQVDTVPGSSSLALSKQLKVRSGLVRGKTQDKDLRSHL